MRECMIHEKFSEKRKGEKQWAVSARVACKEAARAAAAFASVVFQNRQPEETRGSTHSDTRRKQRPPYIAQAASAWSRQAASPPETASSMLRDKAVEESELADRRVSRGSKDDDLRSQHSSTLTVEARGQLRVRMWWL